MIGKRRVPCSKTYKDFEQGERLLPRDGTEGAAGNLVKEYMYEYGIKVIAEL